mgnify:CR=1 FL=1
MKVIRKEDKNSNVYITKFTTESVKKPKYIDKGILIKRNVEDCSELVVYMADGSKPRYENVPEHKVRLLELRYQQFLKNKEKLKELKKLKKIISIIWGSIAGIIIGITALSTSSITIILASSLITISLAAASAIISNKSINSKIDDINKYDLFFVNEDMFKNADLDNPNILEQVKSKDKKEIAMIKDKKDSENEKPYFDNNSIDGLSLDALKRIKANIVRENYLGLVNKEEDIKDKELVKK